MLIFCNPFLDGTNEHLVCYALKNFVISHDSTPIDQNSNASPFLTQPENILLTVEKGRSIGSIQEKRALAMAVHHRNKAIHEQDASGEDDHELARDASESDQLSGSLPLQNDNALRDASELACCNAWAGTTAEEGQDLKNSKSQTSSVRTRIGHVSNSFK